MKFGYVCISTFDKNLDQRKQLEEFGCDRIFFEKITGPKRNRPELDLMLEFLRPEDTVVVTDLKRLSRSTKDLIEITELISQKGAHLKSLKESWLDTTTAHGKMLFTLLANFVQFEKDLTSEEIQAANRIKHKRNEIIASISELSTRKQQQVISHLDEIIAITWEILFRN